MDFSGVVIPIAAALIHVAVFLSTALLAAYEFVRSMSFFDWDAFALKERSSAKSHIFILLLIIHVTPH